MRCRTTRRSTRRWLRHVRHQPSGRFGVVYHDRSRVVAPLDRFGVATESASRSRSAGPVRCRCCHWRRGSTTLSRPLGPRLTSRLRRDRDPGSSALPDTTWRLASHHRKAPQLVPEKRSFPTRAAERPHRRCRQRDQPPCSTEGSRTTPHVPDGRRRATQAPSIEEATREANGEPFTLITFNAWRCTRIGSGR